MILRILQVVLKFTTVGMTLVALIHSLEAAPKSAIVAPNPLPLGQRLPMPPEGIDGIEGQFRNYQWEKMARDLRVRDLRVYDWPQAYNKVGEAGKQQSLVIERLRRAGYKVQKFEWTGYNPADTEGFEAYRVGETLAAMWRNNGSHLLLYWGHQAPATPAQKRDDELLQAAAAEDVARAKTALLRGANPNALDYSGESVLSLAANTGNIPIVKALLRAQQTAPGAAGTKLNIGDWLKFAVARDDTDLLRLFLAKGATPNQIGAALQEAAARGARKCAPLLIEHAPRAWINSALWQAAFVEEWRGSAIQYPDIVKLLLTRKPDKSALDVALLRVAGFDDQGIVVPLLLEAGADPNASDEQGETALIHALKDYDPNSVRNLLKAGADPNAKSARGTPALVMALGTPFDLDELLKYSPDLSARTKSGATALDFARNTLESLTKKAAQKENPNYKDDQAYRNDWRKIVARLEALTQSQH